MSGDGGGEQDPPGQAGDWQQVHSPLSGGSKGGSAVQNVFGCARADPGGFRGTQGTPLDPPLTLSTSVLKFAQFNTKAQVSVLPLALALPSIFWVHGQWPWCCQNIPKTQTNCQDQHKIPSAVP